MISRGGVGGKANLEASSGMLMASKKQGSLSSQEVRYAETPPEYSMAEIKSPKKGPERMWE